MSKAETIQSIIDNGYYLIPIAKGKKNPAVPDWQNLRTKDAGYFKSHAGGLGILTGIGSVPVCGVDIDSLDVDLVRKFSKWCADTFGINAGRVGKAPKTLLMCATDDYYSKKSSRKFLDEDGGVHQLELLGAGQQFVAYGIHPDTNRKYQWDGASPADAPVSELRVISAADMQLMVDKFEELAGHYGYAPKTAKQSNPAVKHDAVIPDDIDPEAAEMLLNHEAPVGLSFEECQEMLSTMDAEDYDLWLRVGMALHHEFGGSDEGLGLWNEWSSGAANYRDFADVSFRWKGFRNEGGNLITMKSIAGRREVLAKGKREMLGAMRQAINTCSDHISLMDEMAFDIGKLAGMDNTLMLEAERLVRERYKQLSGSTVPVRDVRRLLRQGASEGVDMNDQKDIAARRLQYPWASGWVYVAERNVYLNTATGVMLKPEGFKGLYDSELPVGEGVSASTFVLNSDIIPKAERAVYLPGAGRLFRQDAVKCVNYYCDNPIWRPAELSQDLEEDAQGGDARAALFRRHLELLIAGGNWTREVQLFANFLRYVVENPGNKLTWAVLMQGSYGDGKSEPISRLMGRLLGAPNVSTIQGRTIEKSEFTSWAEGHCFAIIEEIKLHGHNRYDIVNTLKTPISNAMIEIHPKGSDPYSVVNTGNYYITTNYTDAIPLAKKDRRYFILFSRFPKEYSDNSKYFDDLFDAIGNDEGAVEVGKWLLSVPYHADFKPKGHAPHTGDKDLLVELSRDGSADDVEELLETDDSLYFCAEYIVYGHFKKYVDHAVTNEVSYRVLNRYLQELEYRCLGKHRGDWGQHRIWVKGNMSYEQFVGAYELRKLLM
jgi:hypothetical protein